MGIDKQLRRQISSIRDTACASRDLVRHNIKGHAYTRVYRAIRPFEHAIGSFFSGAWVEGKEKLSVTPYQKLSPGVRLGLSRNAEQPIEIYKQHHGRLRQLYKRDTVYCMRVRVDRVRNWLALEFEEDVSSVLLAGKLKILVCGKSTQPTTFEPVLYFNRKDRENAEVSAGLGMLSQHSTRALFDVSIPQNLIEQSDDITASKLILKLRDNADFEFKLFDLRVFGLR